MFDTTPFNQSKIAMVARLPLQVSEIFCSQTRRSGVDKGTLATMTTPPKATLQEHKKDPETLHHNMRAKARDASMLHGGIHNYLRLVLALAAITFVHRFLILDIDLSHNFGAVYYGSGDKAAMYQVWWHQYRSAILTGVASDILFVLSASLLAFVFSPRWVILPLIALSIFYAANVEHIHYNFSHIRLATLYMAFDPTFVEGSGLTPEMLLNLFALAAIAVTTYRFSRFANVRYLAGVATTVMIGAIVVLPHSINPLDPGWMQTHPLAFFERGTHSVSDHNDFQTSALDSNTSTPAAPSGQPHNVLVVYLEGVSQHSLTTGDMPFLQSLATDGLSFSRYFGNQLQTSNGLYTSLTGHYPNFLGAASPWDALNAEDAAAQRSLPSVLAQRGYRTAFLQSADLSFMNKAEHLAQLGFQDIKGREAWTEFHSENGWGIDDLGLFEASLDYIDTLPASEPWLVSLLTSGTHAPYNVPSDFLPDEPSRLRALKYADAAAQTLMSELRTRGLLDNTVVIFTADESREPGGKSNIENEILLNWLPLVVAHPNGQVGTVDWPMGATTFRDLTLRLAGDWDRTDIDTLNKPGAPLIFGNYYKSRVFWFDQQRGDFYACYTQDFLCARFNDVSDLTQLAGLDPVAVSQEPQMQAIFQLHEATR